MKALSIDVNKEEFHKALQLDDEIFSFIQSNPLLGCGLINNSAENKLYFTDSFWSLLSIKNGEIEKKNLTWNVLSQTISQFELANINAFEFKAEKISLIGQNDQVVDLKCWIKKIDENLTGHNNIYFLAVTSKFKLSKIKKKHLESNHDQTIDTYVLLEELVDASDDIIFLKDEKMRYILFNEAMCKFCNISREKLFLKRDSEVFPKEMAIICDESDQKALDTNEKNYFEETEIFGRIIETRKFKVKLRNGKIGIGAIIRDITDFKEKQQLIENNQLLLANLTQQLEIVVCQVEVDKTGKQKWNFISNQVKKFIDLTPDEIYENPKIIIEKVHISDRAYFIASVTKSMMTKTVLSCEVKVTTDDPEEKWVHILAKPEIREDQSTIWYGSISNISKKKKIEKSALENALLLQSTNVELTRKKEILISVAAATNELLYNTDLEDAICKTVAIMSAGTEADQGFYFKMEHANDDFYANHVYEWLPNKPGLYNIKKLQKIPRAAFPEAWNAIEKGNIYQTIISDMANSIPHKKVFVANGVKSTIFIPVVVNGKSISIIGFDDCKNPRIWSDYEIAILRTLANSVSHATSREYAKLKFQKTQDLLDTASILGKIGAWEFDIKQNKVTWTDITRKIHEVSQEYIPTLESSINFYNGEHNQNLMRGFIEQAIKFQTPWDLEIELITAKRNKIWVRTIGQAEFIDGECVRLFGSLQDINDEKILKLTLAKSTKEYNELINIIPVGIYKFTEDNVMRYVSNNWCKMTGQTAESVVNKPLSAYKNVHPDDKENFMAAMQQSIIDRKAFQLESRFTVNSKIKWMRMFAEPQRTANGIYEWVGVQVDITENKAIEQQLIDNNKRLKEAKDQALGALRQYASILDSQSVFFIKTDKLGKYTYINDYYLECFGKEFKIGDSAFQSIIPEDQGITKEVMLKCIDQPNISHEIILRKYDKHGEIKACKWEAKAITDHTNNIKEIQCMGFDITDQINSLEELKKLLELTSDQNQKLNSFTHIVSHNIRSHSANFSGVLQLLNETQDTKETTYLLDLLNKSATQLDQTIRNLNEVLSVNVRLDNQLQEKYLKKEIENTLQILAGDINKYKANCQIKISDETAIVVVPAYLDSILINLVSNAIKFRAENRALCITFETWNEDPFQVLAVSDNGQGIDLDRYGHKIFGLYNTFHTNVDSKGFGLYITKSQIESMGGKITIESMIDVGTTFKVYFKKQKD